MRILGGIFLVAGTSVGAGMLALPVVTAAGGFFPALLLYVLCFGFMTSTGLLILEVCLEMPPDTNLVTMASTYLGRFGKVSAWVLYLFLFYCLTVAYLSGGGALLRGWISEATLPHWGGTLLFLALFAPFVYAGAKAAGRLNILLMGGLILSYFLFIAFCFPFVHLAPLQEISWRHSLGALPVIFTSFSYQGIIPTLISYLKRDAKQVRLAIIGGTSIAFLIYLVWEFLILGIVPVEGKGGLNEAYFLGTTAVDPLKKHLGLDFVSVIGQFFAFFAIATSFVGVTLGLFDFLSDSLRHAKKGIRRLELALLTFVPPLLIALIYPSLFITALSMAGGIGCALLLGLLPILMAYVARNRKTPPFLGERQIGGGTSMLILLFAFVMIELCVEGIKLLNF